MHFLRFFLALSLASILLSSCELEEGNRRGYVISKTQELPPDDTMDAVQP